MQERERCCANLLIDPEKITVYDNRTSLAWRTPPPRAPQPAILFHEDFMNELDPSEYECLQECCSDTFNSRSSSFMSHISFSHYFFVLYQCLWQLINNILGSEEVGGPTSNQHWINASCLLGILPLLIQ